jgi:hypothetical protein
MNRDDERVRALLWLGIEDSAGLWEVVWALNTLLPGCAESENRSAAERTLRSLLELGQVALIQAREPYEQIVPIAPAEIEAALDRAEGWAEPSGGLSMRAG